MMIPFKQLLVLTLLSRYAFAFLDIGKILGLEDSPEFSYDCPGKEVSKGFHVNFYTYPYLGFEGELDSYFLTQYKTVGKYIGSVDGVTDINFDSLGSMSQLYGFALETKSFAFELTGFFKAPQTGEYSIAFDHINSGASLQIGRDKDVDCGVVSFNDLLSQKLDLKDEWWYLFSQDATVSLQEGKYYPLRMVFFNRLGILTRFHVTITYPDGSEHESPFPDIFQIERLGQVSLSEISLNTPTMNSKKISATTPVRTHDNLGSPIPTSSSLPYNGKPSSLRKSSRFVSGGIQGAKSTYWSKKYVTTTVKNSYLRNTMRVSELEYPHLTPVDTRSFVYAVSSKSSSNSPSSIEGFKSEQSKLASLKDTVSDYPLFSHQKIGSGTRTAIIEGSKRKEGSSAVLYIPSITSFGRSTSTGKSRDASNANFANGSSSPIRSPDSTCSKATASPNEFSHATVASATNGKNSGSSSAKSFQVYESQAISRASTPYTTLIATKRSFLLPEHSNARSINNDSSGSSNRVSSDSFGTSQNKRTPTGSSKIIATSSSATSSLPDSSSINYLEGPRKESLSLFLTSKTTKPDIGSLADSKSRTKSLVSSSTRGILGAYGQVSSAPSVSPSEYASSLRATSDQQLRTDLSAQSFNSLFEASSIEASRQSYDSRMSNVPGLTTKTFRVSVNTEYDGLVTNDYLTKISNSSRSATPANLILPLSSAKVHTTETSIYSEVSVFRPKVRPEYHSYEDEGSTPLSLSHSNLVDPTPYHIMTASISRLKPAATQIYISQTQSTFLTSSEHSFEPPIQKTQATLKSWASKGESKAQFVSQIKSVKVSFQTVFSPASEQTSASFMENSKPTSVIFSSQGLVSAANIPANTLTHLKSSVKTPVFTSKKSLPGHGLASDPQRNTKSTLDSSSHHEAASVVPSGMTLSSTTTKSVSFRGFESASTGGALVGGSALSHIAGVSNDAKKPLDTPINSSKASLSGASFPTAASDRDIHGAGYFSPSASITDSPVATERGKFRNHWPQVSAPYSITGLAAKKDTKISNTVGSHIAGISEPRGVSSAPISSTHPVRDAISAITVDSYQKLSADSPILPRTKPYLSEATELSPSTTLPKVPEDSRSTAKQASSKTPISSASYDDGAETPPGKLKGEAFTTLSSNASAYLSRYDSQGSEEKSSTSISSYSNIHSQTSGPKVSASSIDFIAVGVTTQTHKDTIEFIPGTGAAKTLSAFRHSFREEESMSFKAGSTISGHVANSISTGTSLLGTTKTVSTVFTSALTVSPKISILAATKSAPSSLASESTSRGRVASTTSSSDTLSAGFEIIRSEDSAIKASSHATSKAFRAFSGVSSSQISTAFAGYHLRGYSGAASVDKSNKVTSSSKTNIASGYTAATRIYDSHRPMLVLSLSKEPSRASAASLESLSITIRYSQAKSMTSESAEASSSSESDSTVDPERNPRFLTALEPTALETETTVTSPSSPAKNSQFSIPNWSKPTWVLPRSLAASTESGLPSKTNKPATDSGNQTTVTVVLAVTAPVVQPSETSSGYQSLVHQGGSNVKAATQSSSGILSSYPTKPSGFSSSSAEIQYSNTEPTITSSNTNLVAARTMDSERADSNIQSYDLKSTANSFSSKKLANAGVDTKSIAYTTSSFASHETTFPGSTGTEPGLTSTDILSGLNGDRADTKTTSKSEAESFNTKNDLQRSTGTRSEAFVYNSSPVFSIQPTSYFTPSSLFSSLTASSLSTTSEHSSLGAAIGGQTQNPTTTSNNHDRNHPHNIGSTKSSTPWDIGSISDNSRSQNGHQRPSTDLNDQYNESPTEKVDGNSKAVTDSSKHTSSSKSHTGSVDAVATSDGHASSSNSSNGSSVGNDSSKSDDFSSTDSSSTSSGNTNGSENSSHRDQESTTGSGLSNGSHTDRFNPVSVTNSGTDYGIGYGTSSDTSSSSGSSSHNTIGSMPSSGIYRPGNAPGNNDVNHGANSANGSGISSSLTSTHTNNDFNDRSETKPSSYTGSESHNNTSYGPRSTNLGSVSRSGNRSDGTQNGSIETSRSGSSNSNDKSGRGYLDGPSSAHISGSNDRAPTGAENGNHKDSNFSNPENGAGVNGFNTYFGHASNRVSSIRRGNAHDSSHDGVDSSANGASTQGRAQSAHHTSSLAVTSRSSIDWVNKPSASTGAFAVSRSGTQPSVMKNNALPSKRASVGTIAFAALLCFI